MSDPSQSPSDKFLATAGGNATAGGVTFQAQVGALFSALLLAERRVDGRFGLGEARVRAVRFETEAPVDDILLETDSGGWIFIQAKSSLTLSASSDSEFGGVADQIVRQWHACAAGTGHRGWDRHLDPSLDRILIAVGRRAAASITGHLASALTATQANSAAPLPANQLAALDTFKARLREAWLKITGTDPDDRAISSVIGYIRICQFDFDANDRQLAAEWLRPLLENGQSAEAAFAVLTQQCQTLMANRLGTDAAGLRQALEGAGLAPKAAPSFQKDVETLQSYSNATQSQLGHYEETKVGSAEIKIERECTTAVMAGSVDGSLLIIGEPGSGKSAVLNSAARRLRDEGHDVVALAVDRLVVNSSDELQRQLGLDHPVRDVLRNWPGSGPAFVFIDALDATRGGAGEAVFRSLIRDVLEIGGRWRLVASIRTFDLRLGEQFRQLYRGPPPDPRFVDASFPDVRHVHIPVWTATELDRLLELAPAIGTTIERGGPSLRELALVPFNTRLLADLISLGLPPENFGQVGSQVELLQLYWRFRVAESGTAAELCLREIVSEMVAGRTLNADKFAAARSNPAAFDSLLRENVLVLLPGDRRAAFRHHILFDYAASRVYLDPDDIDKTAALLPGGSDLGLMLAPALEFALQSLWSASTPGRSSFWAGIARIAGSIESDPIARSVAARAACESPTVAGDSLGLSVLLHGSGDRRAQAVSAFGHIVGALAIRLEDQTELSTAPWCTLAQEASDIIQDVLWPLRTLLFLLTERVKEPTGRSQLGTAARRLLRYALDHPTIASHLTIGAIGFVADTYPSDTNGSTRLLRELLSAERIQTHGHEDLPWLARKIKEVWESDPKFAVEVYGAIFGSAISDKSKTSLGRSLILPLSSTRQQDFGMAQFSLKEAFPQFLKARPPHAIRALVQAVAGHVTVAETIDIAEAVKPVVIDGQRAELVEDGSRFWAWNPNEEHGDNAAGLLKALVHRLQTVPEQEARDLAALVIRFNRFAVIWSRLFMVAAQRPAELGPCLWPYAVQSPFLFLSDTRKDAIDLIAARYGFETLAAREAFERSVFRFDFSFADDPAGYRRVVLVRLFGTIGRDQLVTAEARAFLDREVPQQQQGTANPRPYWAEVSSHAPEQWWWLKQQGVDVEAVENAPLLAEADNIQTTFGLGGKSADPIRDVAGAIAGLLTFLAAIKTGADRGAVRPVTDYAAGMAAAGAKNLAHLDPERLRAQPGALRDLIELTLELAQHPAPEAEADQEARFEESHGWGFPAARIDAAEAAIFLCRVDTETAKRIEPGLDALLRDPHPVVRFIVAEHLTTLWETDRPSMWLLARQVAEGESNRGVLQFFVNACLARLLHADPPQVEELVLTLLARAGNPGEKPTSNLLRELAALVVLLWVSHGRLAARQLLEEWIAAIPDHQSELSQAIASIRGGLVLGYGNDNEVDTAIRRRCHEFAAGVVDATAAVLEPFFKAAAAGAASPTDEELASACVRTLSQIGDQLYFASGAFRSGQQQDATPLEAVEAKRAFLAEVEGILRRIGDVGHPGTIYHLIDLLDFLAPADPERVFDLVAHALLGAGKQHGYQFESLGADRFVQIVGRFLADNRDIFADPARRRTLIACLDTFSDVGWPAARRLLYRLPELLR